MILLLGAPAAAHPLGTGFATETLVVRLDPDRLRLEYAAEVPTELLARRSNGREPLDDLAVELETGLSLSLDGAVVPLVRTARTTDPNRSTHTVAVDAVFEAPFPPGTTSFTLTDANLLDARTLRAADVWVHPSIRVEHASILAERDGRVVRDDGLRWRQDESSRTVSAVVRREPRAWSWLLARGDQPVRAAGALDPHGLARFGPRHLDPLVAVGGLLALVGARTSADPPLRARVLALLLGLGVGLAGPTNGWTELAFVVASGAGAATRWRDPAAVTVALAGLCATVHPLRPALLLGLLVALPMPRPATDRRPVAATAGLAALLALRAAAGLLGG